MPVAYELSSLNLPRLKGTLLNAFAAALDNDLSRPVLMPNMLKEAGVPQLRALKLSEAPTNYPLLKAMEKVPAPKGSILEEASTNTSNTPFTSAYQLRAGYLEQKLRPSDVVEKILSALKADAQHPQAINAFIKQNEGEIRAMAAAADKRYQEGQSIGPLDGIPVAIKDEVNQKGYPTTVGTRFMGTQVAVEDGTSVARLRATGCILIGKANMHEIGINPNGINMHHGLVRNPFDRQRDPGGSSSGSAAAVAAGYCPLALGADGGGSIRIPAGLCGVVGLKATYTRISEHGAAPLCWTVCHLGPIGATVADVALGYAAMAGTDLKDELSLAQPEPSLHGWLDTDLKGFRIGFYPAWFEHAEEDVVRQCKKGLAALEKAGAKIVEIEVPELNMMRVAHAVTILSEMASAMQNYPENFQDFSQTSRISLSIGRNLSALDYVQAQRIRTRAIAHFERILSDVHAVATPTSAITAPQIMVDRPTDGYSDLSSVTEVMRYAFASNLTGHPAISVPSGFDADRMPVGLQFIGRAFAEHTLLRLARVVEQEMGNQVPKDYLRLDT